ncbi:MAG: cbb3-type cytochrome c oxidase N-terminal domain-containing protein [Bacteroidota bacterium]
MEQNAPKNEHQPTHEVDEDLMDHNYDGIQELDNPPPAWIMAIFYITIAFSIIYAAYYFWLDVGDNQDAKYAKKSQLHDAKYQLASQSSEEIFVLSDAADIAEGKAIFTTMNCFACHGMNGEGNAIGPNLTDDAWISGCDFQSVFNMVKNGNPAKGMTAFKAQLSDVKIQQVASYVLSLRGTNPENAKEPQGEQCE